MAFDQFEYQMDSIKSSLEKIQSTHDEMKKQKETLSNPAGEFKVYCKYPELPKLKRDRYGWGYGTGDEYLPSDVTRKSLDNWFCLCKKVRDENKIVEDHNQIIYDKAVAFMLSLGLKKDENYKKTSRSSKWSTREAAWLTSIRNLKGSGYGWKNANDQYVRLGKGIIDREEAKRKDEEAKEKDRKAEIAERKSNLKLALLAQKYVPENPVECETSEILDTILGRCKYLNLAHWMKKNRGDWNDGYAYAETGLGEFEIENELDQEIHDDVYSYIEDWDGDGRVFRDCDHNYDTLFARCESYLLSDYNQFCEMFPDT
tara:strand:+ start:2114 stop:3058 length:945 start_codon:yes stop_codon:yes gene_type:complete